jgi:hypothetical protein
MATNWKLIREVLNGTIDACEAVENLHPELTAGEYDARSGYQPDVCVGDFLNRFWQYPEGAARDIIRIRTHLDADQKHLPETARALIHAAIACAEAMGLPDAALRQELPNFTAHCGSGGHCIQSLLTGIPKIQRGWMLTGITKALEEYRKTPPQA